MGNSASLSHQRRTEESPLNRPHALTPSPLLSSPYMAMLASILEVWSYGQVGRGFQGNKAGNQNIPMISFHALPPQTHEPRSRCIAQEMGEPMADFVQMAQQDEMAPGCRLVSKQSA
jgi:hypothetical protein